MSSILRQLVLYWRKNPTALIMSVNFVVS